jgi:hypothetical protein
MLNSFSIRTNLDKIRKSNIIQWTYLTSRIFQLRIIDRYIGQSRILNKICILKKLFNYNYLLYVKMKQIENVRTYLDNAYKHLISLFLE